MQQDVRLRGQSKLSFGLSVTNLFDQDTAISRYSVENEQGIGLTLNEGDYYAGRVDIQQLFTQQKVLKDARFLMANAFQAPRTARVTVRWSF